MIVLAFFCFTIAMATDIPHGIEVCHKSDPNFGHCFEKSMEKSLEILRGGNKEVGVPNLEPFFLKDMEIGESKSTSLSIQQRYHNVNIFGMTYSKIKTLHLDMNKGCGWSFNAFSPTIKIEGDYELQGQALVFPINSKGKFRLTLSNLNNVHSATCERYTKKGETYIRIVNYTMDMKLEGVEYFFTDLFPGSQQISDDILKAMNDNGLAIFKELQSSFESAFSVIQMQSFNNFVSKFTEEQLFPQ